MRLWGERTRVLRQVENRLVRQWRDEGSWAAQSLSREGEQVKQSFDVGDLAGSIIRVNRLIALAVASNPPQNDYCWPSYWYLEKICGYMRDYRGVVRWARKTIASGPSDTHVLYRDICANLYYLDDYERAIRAGQKALDCSQVDREDVEDIEYRIKEDMLGLDLYHDGGQEPRCKKLLHRKVKHGGEHAGLAEMYCCVIACEEKGSAAELLANKDRWDFGEAFFCMKVGWLLCGIGDYDGGLDWLERGIAEDPSGDFKVMYAWRLFEADQGAKAGEVFASIPEDSEKYPEALGALGRLCSDPDEGRAMCERAIALSPYGTSCHASLALHLHKQGDYLRALHSFYNAYLAGYGDTGMILDYMKDCLKHGK